MLRRVLDLPIWVRLVGAVVVVLGLTLTGMLIWAAREQQREAVEQARMSVGTATEIAIMGLTVAMMTGEVDQQTAYIEQLKTTRGIEALAVLRGDAVNRQFGDKPNAGLDGIDRQVLAGGKPFFGLETIDGKLGYRAVVPVLANRMLAGKNCQTCHEGQPTTVLGAVKLRISLEDVTAAMHAFQRNLLLACIALAIPLLVAAYLTLTRMVSRPLAQVADQCRDIAEGEGDLTRRLTVGSQDEIGRVARWFNVFVEKLGAIMGHAKGTASTVATASQQLSAATEQLASGIQEQASALEETAASLEELTATVKQNAGNARQANELAQTSRETAEQGQTVVAEAVASMSEITLASKKIADIIGTIDGIAFQTNLLALNAAVEAARAGEQGRGFAVVAAEVRNLSQRTGAAAREIKGLIEDSVHKVESGAALVNRSGQTLGEIVTSVKKVTDLVADIASASQEQAQGLDQVNKAVMQMDRVVQSTAAQTDELSSTAHSLADQAEQLQALVGRFKVNERGARDHNELRAARHEAAPLASSAATPEEAETLALTSV